MIRLTIYPVLKSTVMARTAIYMFSSTRATVYKYIMLFPPAKGFVGPD
jgi:hypothetical protein